jgi:hypothetical protein
MAGIDPSAHHPTHRRSGSLVSEAWTRRAQEGPNEQPFGTAEIQHRRIPTIAQQWLQAPQAHSWAILPVHPAGRIVAVSARLDHFWSRLRKPAFQHSGLLS